MKNFIITAIIFMSAFNVLLAQKQGTIVYENTINIHKNLGPDQQALKAMIPETTTQNFEFIFNEQYGCLKNVPSEMPKGMMIKMDGAGGKTWFNFQENVFRQYIEVDEELFHTENTFQAMDVKPTGKSKNILNYTCKEYKSSDGEFSFWVSKDLPKYISPMTPMFFDGAVLAIDNENLSFKAVSFSKEIDEKELTPVESEGITEDQFQDLQEEKMNEMKAMSGKVMKIGN